MEDTPTEDDTPTEGEIKDDIPPPRPSADVERPPSPNLPQAEVVQNTDDLEGKTEPNDTTETGTKTEQNDVTEVNITKTLHSYEVSVFPK